MSESRSLPVNFSSFVVSLAGSAMMHLGEAPNPDSGSRHIDLTLAHSTIDLLGLLQEKTKGNLDEGEERLLSTLLNDLREKLAAAQG